jgi:hypothetical protein
MTVHKEREEVLKSVREKGNLDSEIGVMNLAELRQLHQILFEEAVRSGRRKFSNDFDIEVMKGKIDNAFEHIRENMCTNSVVFCNRKNCDHYDPDCVKRKIRDQVNRLISEILEPSSVNSWVKSRATW